MEQDHIYQVNGVILPSVTEICKPLTVDIATEKAWIRDIAADRGSRAHAFCADIDYGIDDVAPDWDCVGYVSAYKAFLRDYGIKSWLAVELPIYSLTLGAAGTIDRLGYIDNKITILDIKTSYKIDKALLTAQLNGYFDIIAFPDCNYRIDDLLDIQLWGLQLKKDGKYSIYQCRSSPIFYLLLELYKERQEIICKKKG